MNKSWKRWLLIFGIVIVAVAAAGIALFFNELRTLSTLEQVNEYPFYTMTYAGDYGFDDFLKVGAKSDRDIERFVIKRLLKGVNIDLNISSGGCTVFNAKSPSGDVIYGRNFDYDYAPAMLLRTKPKNGYASISMVNLAFAGYDSDSLPKPKDTSSFLTLAAPYLPFDGINECGVAMALLSVPHAEPPQIASQVTLNTTTAIRLVLDKAANVDEAMELLKGYNFYFSGDTPCHYLIADKSGRSVLVEFLDGDIKFTEGEGLYQIASNFIAYQGLNAGYGEDEFQRYDQVDSVLKKSKGQLGELDAMALLSDVAMSGRCQWSLVYNLSDLSVDICIGENYGQVYSYDFEP